MKPGTMLRLGLEEPSKNGLQILRQALKLPQTPQLSEPWSDAVLVSIDFEGLPFFCSGVQTNVTAKGGTQAGIASLDSRD